MSDPVKFDTLDQAAEYARHFAQGEVLITCDHCHAEFYGPALMLLEEWFFKVELAAKYCGSECAIRDIEQSGLAREAAALR